MPFSVQRQGWRRWYVIWPLYAVVDEHDRRVSRFGPFWTRWGAARWGRRIFE